jgi:HSP20 family protein
MVTLEEHTMPVYMITRPWSPAWRQRIQPVGFNGGSRLPVDVHVDDDGYIITASVPGLTPDKVEIKILDNVVTLTGGAEDGHEEDGRYLMREIGTSHFERSFELPDPVDASKAEASMKDGLLTVRLPKAEESRPKVIEIKDR